jgi:hypothetical protein
MVMAAMNLPPQSEMGARRYIAFRTVASSRDIGREGSIGECGELN